ncbi:MAG: DNA polymerase III subunit gamma/tau [Firmicutes bacterium]|nr:DNA polymerase III subunit gamma/tau [Bacillota bacterium]
MYLALYRKFRPNNFDDIIGQEHITKTLINQITNGSIGHAYLFCGSRGTGKTTCAKVFSKAVNCIRPKNGSPCNKCEVCIKLSEAANLDVYEIDAASNNGVDEIRELREKVEYLPVSGKYKVYIIDEVHMLSQSAFNALLKTLEEPPAFVIFVLATTEPHKLPATILSRCMRFDFKLISEEKIVDLISNIYKSLNKDFEKEAVHLIAKSGEGSVRDALSVADICLSYSNGKLTYNDVLEVLGAADKSLILEIAEAVLSKNSESLFNRIEKVLNLGKGVGFLNKDLISVFRDICVIQLSESANQILKYPEKIYEKLQELSKLAPYGFVLRCVDLLSRLENDLKYSVSSKILFETCLLKCANLSLEDDFDVLALRILELEQKLQNYSGPQNSLKPNADEKVKVQKTENKKTESVKEQPKEKQPLKIVESKKEEQFANEAGGSGHKVWGTVIKTLRQNRNGVLFSLCSETECKISGKDLYVLSASEQTCEILNKEANMKVLKDIIKPIGEYNIIIKFNQEKANDYSGLKSFIGDKLIIE